MTTHELAARLLLQPVVEVMILDGFNGGGIPRDLNLGPCTRVVTHSDAEEAADCEDKQGDTVVVLGFGCY